MESLRTADSFLKILYWRLSWEKEFIRRFSPFIALALSLQKQFYKFSEFENRPFYRYGGYIEFTRFKEYYGMPRGALAKYSRALFGEKENFTV